jgi:hypothetical protein
MANVAVFVLGSIGVILRNPPALDVSLNLGLRNPVSTRLRVAKFFADSSADYRKPPHGRAPHGIKAKRLF